MSTLFETKPKSLTREAKYINDVAHNSYELFITNSIYLRGMYKKSLEDHFDLLKNLWLQETKMSSNIYHTINHPAHLQIIQLGSEVLPYILKDLKEHSNHWFYTLNIMTEQNPVKEENVGNVTKMTEDWIEWARTENLFA